MDVAWMGFTSGGIRDDDRDNGVDDVFVQPIANNTSKVIDATDRGVSDGGGYRIYSTIR